MQLREVMENSILEFLTGAYGIEDYVGLSVMTDGLKADRDTVVGLSAVDSNYQVLFTILFNEGNPDKTEAYHGIPVDRFKIDGSSPTEGYMRFLDSMAGKYIVMHGHKFGVKFLNEFVSRHNIPPLDIPVIGSGVMHQALVTPDTILPALSEDIGMNDFMDTLCSFSYPKNTKRSLPALFEQAPNNEYTDYTTRLPEGVGNAFKIVTTYKQMLQLPLFT